MPLIGVVGRFVEQKGFDLLAQSIEDRRAACACSSPSSAPATRGWNGRFGPLPGRYPGRIGSYIGYNEELAHWIEAGADFFLMPSRYEPCGLNQIYSLKYGTLPIVRATGGLNDTVQQYDEATGEGTGFKFFEPDRAGGLRHRRLGGQHLLRPPAHMRQMIAAAMAQDFSWERAPRPVRAAYAQAIANKKLLG